MRLTALLLAVITMAPPAFGAGPTPKHELVVAAASDLKYALDAALKQFAAAEPDVTVRVTYGSSGHFFTQLQSKAPFDVFLSADREYTRQLVEKGLAVKGSEFVYAVGHLVVWVPNASKLDVAKQGLGVVADPAVRKVAVANPKYAPYGRAAAAALAKLGLTAAVAPKLVLGENIAQTAQFAETGAADVGVIALSLALSPALKSKGRYADVPPDAYPRLEQGGVVMNWAKDKDAARRFGAFLTGEKGQTVLQAFGFQRPGA